MQQYLSMCCLPLQVISMYPPTTRQLTLLNLQAILPIPQATLMKLLVTQPILLLLILSSLVILLPILTRQLVPILLLPSYVSFCLPSAAHGQLYLPSSASGGSTVYSCHGSESTETCKCTTYSSNYTILTEKRAETTAGCI